MWQERKPLRSPVCFTLAAETSACLCTTVDSSAPKQQDDEFGIYFISPDSRDSDNVSSFLKWPQIYLSACCWPTLTPPVGLNRIPDALGCCCRATGSHLAHRFALQLPPLRLAVWPTHRSIGVARIQPCFPGNGVTHLLVFCGLSTESCTLADI